MFFFCWNESSNVGVYEYQQMGKKEHGCNVHELSLICKLLLQVP
jgi:hypothetical protein